jgi:hypothetical protein
VSASGGRPYNLIRSDAERISVELHVPGGEAESLGEYPRDWPAELTARNADALVYSVWSPKLAND